jgi:hypothetical protein
MRNVSNYVVISNCFQKIVPFMRCCAKYVRATQTISDDIIGHTAFYMLDNLGCRHILRTCNRSTSCFLTAEIITRTRLSVTFIRKLPALFVVTVVYHTCTT